MKLIFSRDQSLRLRIIIIFIITIVLVTLDRQFDTFNKIRSYLDTVVSPFYFILNSSQKLLDNISNILSGREQLLFENKALKKELLLKKANSLLVEQLKQENNKLRKLLNLPLRQNEQMMVVQALSSTKTPYKDQIIIDKGLNDGVYEGQPVISDKGIIGQVITVSQFNSRVLLICDIMHALPIQILRNDIRVIATGTGCNHDLQLEPLPNNINIRIGDIIVTSGLGGRFPEGYPVAIISSIKHDVQRAYIIVRARPIADLQRLRYLLLLWRNFSNPFHPLSPPEVYQTSAERLIKIFPQTFSCKNKIQK
ncbi:MAG: rod shape-determining protein MreC [Arsenophonus sp. ET-DL9-MAG3]